MKSGRAKTDRQFVDIADEIKKKMVVLSKSFKDISQLVRELQSSTENFDFVEKLLYVRADLPPADSRLFAQAGKILNENIHLNDSVNSPETLRRLAGLEGEALKEAVRTLIDGQTLDGEKIDEVESFVRWIREGDERTEVRARKSYLENLARATVGIAITEFERMADGFISSVHTFVHSYFSDDGDDKSIESVRSSSNYVNAHRDLASLAALVLDKFHATFGEIQSLGPDYLDRSEVRNLSDAVRALKRFADGRFGHDGGFGLNVDDPVTVSFELVDAIAYLGSQDPGTLEQVQAQCSPPDKLRVLELGAGAGGMAIGLMAAGFRHVGMYEGIKKRVNTLRKNWPRWPVQESFMPEVSELSLEPYRGVDLLAASLPGQPFARKSTPDDHLSENNHFPDAVRVIRTVLPRAFILHTVETVTLAQHATYLADICVQLTGLGYRTEQVRLKPSIFGLPQEVERFVIVGIRDAERGTFLSPTLVTPVSRGIGEALAPALVVHKTSDHSKADVPRYTAQWHYDEWARDWARWYRSKLLATIPTAVEEERIGPLDALKKVGVDGSSYAERPFAVGDVTDNHMLPKLTVGAIALAQGFPAKWSFEAKPGGNIDMIAEALPPVLARAVGLRIYSALTGWKIDLDAALAEPIINDALIGISKRRSPLLRPKYYTAERVRQAQAFLEREGDMEAIPRHEERTEAHTRLVAEIIPSKRGNGAAGIKLARIEMLRIAASMRSSRDHIDYPPDDGFKE